MPIRDHFHPPINSRVPWPSLHGGWIAEITGRLNELMPREFLALDSLRLSGGLEIDIAAVDGEPVDSTPGTNGPGGVAVATAPAIYAPPAATGVVPFDIPEVAEIRVFVDSGERKLVGAIELVSPGNKDRAEARELFVGKCLDYLASGACVVIVDVVTGRNANLHNEVVQRLRAPADVELVNESTLYAATYRPVRQGKKSRIDIWVESFAVGDPLPTMPLRLVADYFVPVELEATYTEACRRRRLIP